jgi:hypothetical protein
MLELAYDSNLLPDPKAFYTCLQNSDGTKTYKLASKNISSNILIKTV